jgi:hypothetical protein
MIHAELYPVSEFTLTPGGKSANDSGNLIAAVTR